MVDFDDNGLRPSDQETERAHEGIEADVSKLKKCWAVQEATSASRHFERIGDLTIALERTELIRQHTELLIGHRSRWATTVQFLSKVTLCET